LGIDVYKKNIFIAPAIKIYVCFKLLEKTHHQKDHAINCQAKWTCKLTDTYSRTSAVATTEADIRLAGSTEYSARTFLIPLICHHIGSQIKWLP